ncbi:MAG: hypothetical protein WCF47_23555 [Pseudolabrys sp.]
MTSILAEANEYRKMAGCIVFNCLVDQDMMIFNNNSGVTYALCQRAIFFDLCRCAGNERCRCRRAQRRNVGQALVRDMPCCGG